MAEQVYVGVDLGGTAIKAGLCDSQGRLLHTFEGPTGKEQGSEAVLNNITQYVRSLVEGSSFDWDQVAGIGAGVPGFLDIHEGSVKLSPNLRWHDVPIRTILEEKLGKPVRIENDANAAALAEAWVGAGEGISDCVCYTLGTGVGGGLIVNGRICRGYNGLAGELGHMVVVPDLESIACGCGKKGCLETVSSATGIVRMAEEAVERGEHTSLALVKEMTAKDVFDAAKTGDEVALRIVNRAATYLGKSMAVISIVLNPQRFIVGGGVSKAGDLLLDAIRRYYSACAQEMSSEGVDIVAAELGNKAGMIGAAGLFIRG